MYTVIYFAYIYTHSFDLMFIGNLAIIWAYRLLINYEEMTKHPAKVKPFAPANIRILISSIFASWPDDCLLFAVENTCSI